MPILVEKFIIQNRRYFSAMSMNQSHTRPENMKEYCYPSLPEEYKDAIRLVKVIPGASPNQTTFKLVTKCLSETPKYFAISYVWSFDDKCPQHDYGLVVDGKWLATTKNTFEILHEHSRFWQTDPRFQQGSSEIFFWIDYLCINQKDDKEKSREVKLMGQIYSQADTVISFLQPEDPDDPDVAIHFLQSLLHDVEISQRKRHYGLFPAFMTAYFFTHVIAGIFSSRTGLCPSAGWCALSRLLAHKYWSRVWIVQELALSAGRLRIYYGDRVLNWVDLFLFVHLLEDFKSMQLIDTSYAAFVHGQTIAESRYCLRQSIQLMERYGKSTNDKEVSIQRLLTSVTAMGATYDVDCIWALWGLIPEDLREHFPSSMYPDYERTTAERLFYETARCFLERIDPEWLLSMAGIS